ncbi:MAG: hypothetical protein NWF13_10145 [Candidatus Bathyarchaeota archaeon]|nr:hypothetical protein [Candidatus Bathyarchaeota archaeon]
MLVGMVDRGLGYVSVVGFPGRNRCTGPVYGFRARGLGAIKALSAGGLYLVGEGLTTFRIPVRIPRPLPSPTPPFYKELCR